MQFEAKCDAYVKRDVPRMLIKTFSAAWLPSRNPHRFLGIVIVHPGDSGLCIPLYHERNAAAYLRDSLAYKRIFEYDRSDRLLSRQSYRLCRLPLLILSRKYEHPSRNIFFSNIITKLFKIFLHPKSCYLKTRRLSAVYISSLICLQM